MQYCVVLSRKAEKELSKLPKQTVAQIIEALEFLENEPLSGKSLAGKLIGMYSYRVWPYRIIYTIEHGKLLILIIAIGHRKDIYEKLDRTV